MKYSSIQREKILERIAQAVVVPNSEDTVERLLCILHYCETGSVTKTCAKFNITRTTLYRWLNRVNTEPTNSLEDKRKHRVLPIVKTVIPEQNFAKPQSYQATGKSLLQGRIRWFSKASHWLFLLCVSAGSLLAITWWNAQSAQASSWSPTLLVNTESFVEIDEGDGTTDVSIQFGNSLADQLSFNSGLDQFTFTKNLQVDGSITASGAMFINSDQQGDATLTFGNALANQTISVLDGQNTFMFSTGATFAGGLSGSSLTLSSLTNCDTIDTDANGNLICGTDQNTSATDAYVDELGDTMAGSLKVDIDVFTGSYLQPNDTSLTANLALWLDASQITGLSDGDPVASWADASGNGNTVIQTNGTYQPTYQTSEIGGAPVVRFDGTDDYLIDIAASYTARTVFIVQRISSTAQQTSDLAQLWGNYSDGVQVAPDPRQTEGFWSFDGNASASARCGTNGDTYNSTLANGIACDWNYDTAQMHAIEFTVNEPLSGTTIGSLAPAFAVGAHQYGGDIAEIIVYNRVLTDTEREGIEAALSDKYDLDISFNSQVVNTNNSIAIEVISEATNAPGIAIDAVGTSAAPHLAFGTGGIFDTNLYRSGANALTTDDSLFIGATVSGSTINGFGLADCDAENAILQWDAAIQKFVCNITAGNDNLFIARSTDGADFTANPRLITWEAQDAIDATHFAHTVNSSDITLVTTGWYRLHYLVAWDQSSHNNRVGMRCYLTDGGTLISGTESYGYSRDDTQVSRGSCSASFIFENTVTANIVRLQVDAGNNDADYNDTFNDVFERESVSIVLEYLGP